MSENKISIEVAEAEFDRFMDLMDLDNDSKSIDSKDQAEFDKNKDRIIRALMKGSLTINGQGEPVFSPTRSPGIKTDLTFYEPSGATLMAMDRKKEGQNMSKIFSVMDDMTKSPAGTASKLIGNDYKIGLAVVTIFLG